MRPTCDPRRTKTEDGTRRAAAGEELTGGQGDRRDGPEKGGSVLLFIGAVPRHHHQEEGVMARTINEIAEIRALLASRKRCFWRCTKY